MPEPKLHRTTFSQSRAAEYLDLDTLQKLTGRTADDFPRVVVKELLDNALDAAETSGIGVPHVCVRGWLDGRLLVLEVHDNGLGIPAGVVERALDFSTLTSDKALYRTPTRGQQGNALKTIFGMPYALGASGASPRIWIDSAAGALPHRHGIAVRLGVGEQVEIDHEITPLLRDGLMGTRVTVRLPERRPRSGGSFGEQIADLARAYHLFNPHAKVSFSWFGSDSDHGESGGARTPEIAETHHPSVPSAGYRKFMPDDLLVVHWYDVRSFTQLIRSYVSHGEDMPLGEFLAKFRGFTSRPKASAARRAVPDARNLSDLSDADVRVLFGAMRSQVKAPSHAVLGDALGEGHLVGVLRNFYGGERAWYKRIKTGLNGAPAVIEAAVVETSGAYEGSQLFVGLNHTPTYSDPLAEAYISNVTSSAHIGGRGIWGFLHDARVVRGSMSGPGVCVAVHITAASPSTTDRGKTRLAPDPVFQSDLGKALWSVSKVLYKEAKKRERDALAAERDAERRARQQANRRITKAQACYEVMPEAYAYSTGDEALPTTARDLYYAVRNRIERFGYDADELSYKYFSQDVLPAYRREVSELPLVEYEPRGILYEPHGGKEVRLGTRSVAEYNFPDYVFNKILYIEKNGRVGILQAGRVDRRHDMALIGGQGFATQAIRTLFATAEKGKYQLFVLHDADPYGYGIARTLREETERMPGYSVDVIDMGLRLGDALAMGKRPETFTRKSRMDEKTEAALTDLEREYFVGRERTDADGKPYWIASRVELNDLSSPQLVEYVEDKLEEHDALGKVIPPPDALKVRREKMFRDAVGSWVDEIIAEMLGTDELKESMAEEFEERFKLQGAEAWIESGFEYRDDTQSWRNAVKRVLRDAYVGKHKDAIQDAVREHIRETVAAEDEGDEE